MNQILFKNQPVNLEGSLPTIGSKIENFSFTLQNLQDQNLSFFQNKSLILWFVPSLDTGTCITSTKKLNEHLKKNKDAKALILSMDLPFAQNRICGLEKLENVITGSLFRHQETLTQLGLMMNDGPLKGLSARCCLVVDADLKVKYIQLVKEVTQEPDYASVFQAL